MRALNITQANFENQRQTVAGRAPAEHRQPALRPSRSGHRQPFLRQLRLQALHDRLDGRSRHAATIQDVADFFRIYYAPNNAVLTLVGDFDPDEALAKVKKYFGSIPAQAPPPKVDLIRRAALRRAPRDHLRPARPRCRAFEMAYHIPPGNTPDNYAVQRTRRASSGKAKLAHVPALGER